MGMLIEGTWSQKGYDTSKNQGAFERSKAAFRDWIRADGSSPYPPAAQRYHLYVSYACPWANRTLIVRRLKGLEEAIGVTVVHPLMLEKGWVFDEARPDPHHSGVEALSELYVHALPTFTGRVTVPVLWDTQTDTMVNNESSEIIRMFNSEMNALSSRPELDLYPEALREEIDALNDRIYETVNDGVYRCGFASRQEPYDKAFNALFDTLDMLEERLSKQRYLTGSQLTEADVRLFVTLARFDSVYHTHFKCNRRRIIDYPNLWGFTRDLYQTPGIGETLHLDHIINHYYRSHPSINPHRIVPGGPELNFDEPHQRG